MKNWSTWVSMKKLFVDFYMTILVTKATDSVEREWGGKLSFSEAWLTGHCNNSEGAEVRDPESQPKRAWRIQPWGLFTSTVAASVIKSPRSQPMSLKNVLRGTFIKIPHHLYSLPSFKPLWMWTYSEFLHQPPAQLTFPSYKNTHWMQAIQMLTWGLKTQV